MALSREEKSLLTCGDGSWHTHSVGDIPSVMMCDGPHGLRKQQENAKGINDSVKATCFPTACALASSWNVNNAALVAQCIAEAASAEHVSLVLGPGINIKRSPLCGRNFEYFSEDPVLAGHMASAYVSSMQANGIGSCLKHFAVNSQETHRMTIDAIVDERALREIYLAAFEYTITRSQPYAVMASYNKVNGTSATENEHLLTDILRKQWGFDGIVISDWGASYNTAKAIAAGMDLEMPEEKSGYHRKSVLEAVESGALDENCLDCACDRIEKFVSKCLQHDKEVRPLDLSRHREVCLRVAEDSAVLLKNDGLLPLDNTADFCVIGELAEKPRYQGAGSSHINSHADSFLDVLHSKGNAAHYAKGYTVDEDIVNGKLEEEAVRLALQHKVVIFFGGLTDIFEGEGYDRKTLHIPNNQQNLLSKLRAVNSNIVFVAFGGSPFVMPWLNDVSGLLNMYLGGECVMEAAYNLLFGNVSPSGRLAETFPIRLENTPCYNYFANDRFFDEHRESIFVGYRYYNTFNVPVLFPFGYGLSYAQFAYDNLVVKRIGNEYKVSVTVSNLSDKSAADVVQLYINNPPCNFLRANRELKAFDKVYLNAGETRTVKFVLSERDFSVFYRDRFVPVNGKYAVAVCKDVQHTLLTQQITVDFGIDIEDDDRQRLSDYFVQTNDTFTVSDAQFALLTGWTRPLVQIPKRGEFTLLNTLEDMQNVGLIKVLMHFVKKVAKKQSPTKRLTDPVAQMILSGAQETPLISLMSVGGIHAKYILFLLHHANRKHGKALQALFGRISDK